MPNVFLSYSHRDQQSVQDVKSMANNSNHPLSFSDRSLAEPVMNDYGHINRRSPRDPASEPVRKRIQQLLSDAGKLVVLIGSDTHSSLWVQWEINTFIRLKQTTNRVLLMRIPNNILAGAPSVASHLPVTNWDPGVLARFCQ